MLGRVFPVAQREVFKVRVCRRLIPEGRERREAAQGGDLNRGRRLGGGERRGSGGDGVSWSCGGLCGDGTRVINI